jgi:hypothetical protein
MGLSCCGLDPLNKGPDVLYAFIGLGRGKLSQDLVAECAEAAHEGSVGAGWHAISVVRSKALKAFDVFFEFACMLFNWVWICP